MSALLLGCLNSGLKVSDIIQAVKNTDNINSVSDGFLYKVRNHIVRVMIVSKDVLATEQHLELCVLETGSQFSESLPRIFLQETQAGIKSSAAPAFYRVVANFIHFVNDRKHLISRHSCCKERLMRITKNGLNDLNRLFLNFCHFIILLPGDLPGQTSPILKVSVPIKLRK